MRVRFFITIFVALLMATSAVSIVQFTFFSRERTRLIDQQVDVVASSLLSSGLDESALEEIEDIIADALESEPATALVTVYGPQGEIQYRNANAKLVFDGDSVPLTPVRQTVEEGDHFVRIVNLHVPREGRTLQVGLLLDRGQVQWKTLNFSVLKFGGLILSVILAFAALLTLVLLRPLSTLADHLRVMSVGIGTGTTPGMLPKKILLRESGHDELANLISAVRELGQKLEGTFRVNRASAAQMAHEFKTPLTILKNALESADLQIKSGNMQALSTLLKEANAEIEQLNRVISGFLEWSGTEHGLSNDVIHAIKLVPLVQDQTVRLASIYGDRCDIEVNAEATIFGRRDLVEQMIQNLIGNALKYSMDRVLVRISENRLEVIDAGPGLPQAVVERFGLPFNIGPHKEPFSHVGPRSTGLGLAWVVTICKLYGWTISHHRHEGKTTLRVEF